MFGGGDGWFLAEGCLRPAELVTGRESVVYEQSGITCDEFQSKESICAALTEQVNAAQNISQKAAKAKELIEVAEGLLACEEYEEANVECRYCRRFSVLRKKTAALILKMGSLGG